MAPRPGGPAAVAGEGPRWPGDLGPGGRGRRWPAMAPATWGPAAVAGDGPATWGPAAVAGDGPATRDPAAVAGDGPAGHPHRECALRASRRRSRRGWRVMHPRSAPGARARNSRDEWRATHPRGAPGASLSGCGGQWRKMHTGPAGAHARPPGEAWIGAPGAHGCGHHGSPVPSAGHRSLSNICSSLPQSVCAPGWIASTTSSTTFSASRRPTPIHIHTWCIRIADRSAGATSAAAGASRRRLRIASRPSVRLAISGDATRPSASGGRDRGVGRRRGAGWRTCAPHVGTRGGRVALAPGGPVGARRPGAWRARWRGSPWRLEARRSGAAGAPPNRASYQPAAALASACAPSTAPLGSPVWVPGVEVTKPNTTARKVPSPSTTQIIRSTSTCGFARKKLLTSRMVRYACSRSNESRKTGGDLLSQALTGQVPSALRGLTALFGMGRGVSPSP